MYIQQRQQHSTQHSTGKGLLCGPVLLLLLGASLHAREHRQRKRFTD